MAIRPIDVKTFLNALYEREYFSSVICKYKSMLVQIFSAAEMNEIIPRNPASNVKKIKKIKKNEKDAFTEEEVELLKENLPDDLMGNSILRLIGSGVRVQELLALTKADIAPDGSMSRVNKAVKMVDRTPALGWTKSARDVPICEDFRKYVRYLAEHGGDRNIWTSDRENDLYVVSEFRNLYMTL